MTHEPHLVSKMEVAVRDAIREAIYVSCGNDVYMLDVRNKYKEEHGRALRGEVGISQAYLSANFYAVTCSSEAIAAVLMFQKRGE
jgi:hypothetical protein